MSTEIFAKIGDIKGESTDARHPDEIDVVSFSWGVAQTGPTGGGGGGGAGRTTFQDLLIVHTIDSATPALLLACATGRHLPQATISHRKAGENQQDYLTVKLSDVTITALTQNGLESQPYTETVSLRFTKVDLLYRRRRPDGSLDEGQHFIFDVRTNQPG
ncbi:type VI secretion system tube protein Hcp [Mycolicibacterium porcinum]|uniref:Hcp family type VI secretion system effector n=1 Tax=Mycolicibacterium porcinum TaxID=39693 RepID=UPI001197E538|nr:type VI secretion system tube protein Hcp [Mycolicibacterium porcinum]TVY05093.1 type VI secretion system tube protein Hcp [Mycolicibacterium porcinum]